MPDNANVLVGVATLSIREPNDAIAEWSTVQQQAGVQSVRLHKGGSGAAGSTHFQMVPPTGITLTAWTVGIAAGQYSFYHYLQAINANWVQMEFRFEDPNSDAWVELTWAGLQSSLGTAAWVQQVLLDADTGGYGGIGETGASFFNWGPLTAMSGMEAAINGEGVVDTASDWILERVRLELWEAEPERTCFVDTLVVANVAYTIEPGGTAPAMSLSSPFTEVGYTEDGVVLTYTADEADIEVEEETFPIDRVITKETMEVTCNLAENTLANIDNAMAGAVLVGNLLTLGSGVNKTLNLKIEGVTPAGFLRAIQIQKCTATGAVGQSYRKGEKTMIPVTFQALKTTGVPAVTIVDNSA
ncbi:hypothetical protein LCGC14_2097090 [marine sediment metagenome]|uniref:Uncharacterized protein n=1 Tax=marine sediment metagenome TaxID=412755 RepID=A0A0F9GP89_9ZZZZ